MRHKKYLIMMHSPNHIYLSTDLLVHPEPLPAVVALAEGLAEEVPPEDWVPGLPHHVVVHLQPLRAQIPPHRRHLPVKGVNEISQ